MRMIIEKGIKKILRTFSSLVLVVLAFTAAVPPSKTLGEDIVLKKIIIKASQKDDRNYSPLPEMDWSYEAFKKRARNLDSLLAIHTALDTVGGRIGHERVAGMAEGFMGVGDFERSLKWWKILYRVDKKKRFIERSVRGMLISAVALADSIEMVRLCEISDRWPDELKRDSGMYLVHILDVLRMRGADNLWLRNKLKALHPFLPEPDAKFLEAQLALDIRDFDRAYNGFKSIMDKYHPDTLDSLQAVTLLQGIVISSFFSGRVDESQRVIGEILQFGSAPLINMARWWRANLSYIEGRKEEAKTLYSILCSDNIEDSCFWQDYLKKLEELKRKVKR